MVRGDMAMLLQAEFHVQEGRWNNGWRAGRRYRSQQTPLYLPMRAVKSETAHLKKFRMLLYHWLLANSGIVTHRGLSSGARKEIDFRHFSSTKDVAKQENSGLRALVALLTSFKLGLVSHGSKKSR